MNIGYIEKSPNGYLAGFLTLNDPNLGTIHGHGEFITANPNELVQWINVRAKGAHIFGKKSIFTKMMIKLTGRGPI